MNIRKRVLPVALAGLMVSASALAGNPTPTYGPSPMNTNAESPEGTQGAGGQVNFTGSISDVSCNISTPTVDVDLGKWAKSYFATRSETTQTPFTISVNNCPSSVKNVAVLFDGEKDNGDSTLLKLTPNGAKGVGIKLYNADRIKAIPIGTISDAVPVTSGTNHNSEVTLGSATLNFFANYKSDGNADDVTVGTANAVSNFVMVYN